MWPPRDPAKVAIISGWTYYPKYFCSKTLWGILKVATISGWPNYPVATLSGVGTLLDDHKVYINTFCASYKEMTLSVIFHLQVQDFSAAFFKAVDMQFSLLGVGS